MSRTLRVSVWAALFAACGWLLWAGMTGMIVKGM